MKWRRTADLEADEDDQSPSAPTFAAGEGAIAAVRPSRDRLRIKTYDAESDVWSDLRSPNLASRFGEALANTSQGWLIWGGYTADGKGLSDGAVYAPVDDTSTPSEQPASTPMAVTLYHCGINPIDFDGRTWEVAAADLPFDQTNAPASFVGQGTVTLAGDDELRYRDESGVVVRFVPGDGRPDGMCA